MLVVVVAVKLCSVMINSSKSIFLLLLIRYDNIRYFQPIYKQTIPPSGRSCRDYLISTFRGIITDRFDYDVISGSV